MHLLMNTQEITTFEGGGHMFNTHLHQQLEN